MKSHQLFFHQYHKMYRPFIAKLNQELAKYELYSSQWSVLLLIHREGALTLGEISEHQLVERPTVTRTVQRLKRSGYVNAKPGEDKREKKIYLTELGENICTDMQMSIEQFQKEALQGISEEEQLKTSRILAKVYSNFVDTGGKQSE